MKKLMLVAVLWSSVTAQADDIIGREVMRRDVAPPRQALEDLYFSLADLAIQDQREQMWALPSKTKSALWKYNIERYLRNHPELGGEAQEVLREGIRLVTTPAWFDITPGSFGYQPKVLAREELKARATSMLSQEAVFEVFIRLGPEPVTIPVAKPTADRRRVQTEESWSPMCHCASEFDCGSNASYGCFSSYCIDTMHCGWQGDELCIGKCKATGE
ncbi:MAG TPA: bacteriocin fulvocin C-related protein [Thermoanaerobaculia bacterium]|jgi:hypothetical protein